jgi:hypothetical protein
MAQLIAKCRLTGHYAFMGIEIGGGQVAGLPDIFTRKFCPFCCCEHDWYKKDIKLIDKKLAPSRDIQRSA